MHAGRTSTLSALTAVLLPLLVASVPAPLDAVAAAAVAGSEPRIAFTDGTDHIALYDNAATGSGQRVGRLSWDADEPEHEGEASSRPASSSEGDDWALAFVSTAPGGPDGQVVVQSGDGRRLTVTCDEQVKTSPVLRPDGRAVVYASAVDRGAESDLWVVSLPDAWDDEEGGDVPPCVAAQDAPVRVTGPDDGDDLGPTWTPDSRRLVFSSTRDDPLGDLHVVDSPVPVPDSSVSAAAEPAPPRTLTPDSTGIADTSPVVVQEPSGAQDGGAYVVFTTTRFRPDGSLAVLPLTDDPSPPPVHSVWPASGPRQSGEAAWLPSEPGDGSTDPPFPGALAYTSADTDPDGDVHVATMSWSCGRAAAPGAFGGTAGLTVTRVDVVGDEFEAGCALFTFDANDVFLVNGTARSLNLFELVLSVGDQISGDFVRDPAGTSTFRLDAEELPSGRVAPGAGGDDSGAGVSAAAVDGPPPFTLTAARPVAARPAAAESHPAWLSREDDGGRLAVTERPAAPVLSDVVAADGSDRRVLDPALTVPGGEGSASGLTQAPDLLDAGGLRPAPAAGDPDGAGPEGVGRTAVDLVFDEEPVVQEEATFSLVLDGRSGTASGTVLEHVPGGSPGPEDLGGGRWRLTVEFENPDGPDEGTSAGDASDPTLVAAQVARAAVAAGSVRGAGSFGSLNPLQAVDVTDGRTTRPDLDAVAVGPLDVSGDSAPVAFRFDQDLDEVMDPELFSLYDVTGASSGLSDVRIDPADPARVLATVAGGRRFVGGSVGRGATTGLPSVTGAPGGLSAEDEEPVRTPPVEQARTGAPTYSPDGLWLAYAAETTTGPRGTQIVLAAADGSGRVSSVPRSGASSDRDPAWSPDGRLLAFTRATASGDRAVFVVEVDGTAPGAVRQVTQPAPGSGDPDGYDDVYETVDDEDPGWSPDSERLVLSRTRRQVGSATSASGRPEVWVVDVDGSDERPLLTAAPASTCCESGLAGRAPAWSPDGDRLAYETDGQIEVAPLSTGADGSYRAGAASAVTGWRSYDPATGVGVPTPSRERLSATSDPAWSPDGTRLAFSGRAAGRPDDEDVYSTAVDGTDLRRVAGGPGPETEPAWQPEVDLSLAVTTASTSLTVRGTTVLTATVTNAGPGLAAAPVVRWSLPAGLVAGPLPPECAGPAAAPSCTLAPVVRGASGSSALTVRAVAAGTWTATATVTTLTSDPVPGNDEASVTVTVRETDDLAVELTVEPSAVDLGQPATARLVVHDQGDVGVERATVRLTLPAGVTVPAPPDGCTAEDPTRLRCTVGPLPVDGRATVELRLQADRPGTFELTADVTAERPDRDPSDDRDTAVLEVREVADLGLVLAADPTTVDQGDSTEVRATIGNAGPGRAAAPVLVLTVPAGLVVEGAGSTCDVADDRTTCRLSGTDVGGSSTLVFRLRGRAAGTYTVTARVSSGTPDRRPGDDVATVTVRVLPTADLAVELTAQPREVEVDGTTTLRATVVNRGPQSAVAPVVVLEVPRGLRVLTPLPPACFAGGTTRVSCPRATLVPGGSTRLDLVVRRVDGGGQTVTAQVRADTADRVPGNDTARVTIGTPGPPGLPGDADLELVVTAGTTPGHVGGRGELTFTVRNGGTLARDVRLLVTLPGDDVLRVDLPPECSAPTGCSLGTLEPGTSTSTTAPVRFLREGDVTVSAVARAATGGDADGRVTVPVVQPRLTLLPPVAEPGQVTFARGEDFPAGARVQLSWDSGITTGTPEVVAEEDGQFMVPVLVLRRDLLGERDLRVLSEEDRFAPLESRVLVVPRQVGPPRFLNRG